MNKTLLSVSAILLVCTSCSSVSRRSQENAAPQETDAQKIERLQNQNKELTSTLASVTSKLDAMETRLASMNDKLDSTRGRIDNLVENQRGKPAPVKTVPTEGAVNLPPAGDDDAEAAFTSDEPVRKYRQAMILFQSRNYPDASLAFSAFVDQYPDHALAGSAQYYLGESYYKQGEYKLAARELSRVITSYDRSPHIADTLRDLADAEDKNGQTEDAARHRQLLTSLFPHSPAAHSAPTEEGSEVDAPPKAAKASPAQTPVHTPAHAQPKTQSQGAEAPIPAKTPEAPAQAEAPSPGSTIDAPPPTAPLAPTGAHEQESGHP